MNQPALIFRKATRGDVPAVVRLLTGDPISARREVHACASSLPAAYYLAFEAIDRDPNNQLVVAQLDGQVVGVLQMTFIPGMTYQGGWRALIEGVHVDSAVRSRGIGHRLFEWAIERARQRACCLVQLTSNKARGDAIRFYEALGFVASHEGLKLHLAQQSTPGPQ